MKKSVICDIDGVILHNNDLVPGADRFVHRLLEQGSKLLFLTNYPPRPRKICKTASAPPASRCRRSASIPPPWAPPTSSSVRTARRPM